MKQTKPLVKLGSTCRTVGDFGQCILIDQFGTKYKHVVPEYAELLANEYSLNVQNTVVLDFKLPRASGKRWPEPPRKNQELIMYDPEPGFENEVLCVARVGYVNLEHNRSVGIVHITDIKWLHPVVNNIFSNM